MKRTITITLIMFACVAGAKADPVELGQIRLTGDFTLNHQYDFNNPVTHPFGSFGAMTAQTVTGVFLKWAHGGDVLGFSNGNALNTVSSLPVWTLGRLTLSTSSVLITGSDVGRFVVGALDIVAPGFTPPPNATAIWSFTAPPYDIGHFDRDITGPITLTITWYDDGSVPIAELRF